MKKIKYLLLMILLLPFTVMAAGSVTVDTTSLSMDPNTTKTFKITANNSAGKVTITSSDTSVVTVDKSSEWIENQTITVTASGKQTGSATITIVVNAATFDEEVLKKTYTIQTTVNREKSSDNTLSDLKVDDQTIDGFSSSKTSYTLEDNSGTSIVIAATATDSNATISGVGTKKLAYGENKFNVVVTAENGTKKTYTIIVNKPDPRSTNNDLKKLSLDKGTINFDKNTTSYTVELDNDITEITITATADDSKATITGTGKKTLVEGTNEFQIVVKAENAKTKTYTINVIRKSAAEEPDTSKSDTSVKAITVANYDIDFDGKTKSYNISVDEDVDHLDINVVPNNNSATVRITGNENFKPGSNKVTIRVTAPNGSTNEYTINVNKASKEETPATEPVATDEAETNNWKTIVIIAIIVLIVLIVGFIISKKVFKNDDSNDNNINNNSGNGSAPTNANNYNNPSNNVGTNNANYYNNPNNNVGSNNNNFY